MCRALRDIHPGIVHAHTPKGGLIGMISSFLVRTPVRIYHIRGLPYMAATGKNRFLLRWSEKLSCLLAHEVFCVSHSIRQFAVQDGLVPAEKIKVFLGGSGNGVDATTRFNPQSFTDRERCELRKSLGISADDLVIAYVGRLVRDKGVEELAAAWRVLREGFPSARLLLAGPFEPKDAISDDTRDFLEADPRVVILGDVPDAAPYYSIADIVALPTYREGFPNVPLEAAAMELPVVATTIPGCTDAVEDGVTGTLVPPRDANALRLAIERYLEDPELRRAHGLAGRERVMREFRQEDIWEAIYQEYCRLLEQKGLPVPEPEAAGRPSSI
jgi:glycosyltransferase involved in cell wall biosynthesis